MLHLCDEEGVTKAANVRFIAPYIKLQLQECCASITIGPTRGWSDESMMAIIEKILHEGEHNCLHNRGKVSVLTDRSGPRHRQKRDESPCVLKIKMWISGRSDLIRWPDYGIGGPATADQLWPISLSSYIWIFLSSYIWISMSSYLWNSSHGVHFRDSGLVQICYFQLWDVLTPKVLNGGWITFLRVSRSYQGFLYQH